MKRHHVMKPTLARLFGVWGACFTATAFCDETYVISPSSPDQIQWHIDNILVDGDTIQLEVGRYLLQETVDTRGLAITLRGVADNVGNPRSILDGRGLIRVLACLSGEGSEAIRLGG